MTDTYDLVIVGGGPAGASAAIFASRAGLRTLVLDSDKGMTRRALVNNLLGFPEVTAVRPVGDGVQVSTSDDRVFEANQALLTTGASVALAAEAGITTRPATE